MTQVPITNVIEDAMFAQISGHRRPSRSTSIMQAASPQSAMTELQLCNSRVIPASIPMEAKICGLKYCMTETCRFRSLSNMTKVIGLKTYTSHLKRYNVSACKLRMTDYMPKRT